MRRVASVVMLTFLLVGILMLSSRISLTNVAGQLEPMDALVPYVPETDQIELSFREDNDTSYIDVSITFGTTGYSVSDWGIVTIIGNNISVNAEIWVWTGISLPVVVTKSHTYNLGNLTAGEYVFTFEAWECSVRNITFTVEKSKLLLEADKGIYKLGENITIMLTNIGNHTIQWIGRWPVPWDIFTYPENRCVFAAVPCYCIFELPPGENVSYTWNQSDMFTIHPVEPGIYEVRDNQAWELSVCFRIVNAEIIVPDDYPTIQEAINAASDGDTVFVRNGTYYENVVVNKSVSLIGENADTTTIDGNETGKVVHVIANGIVISGFTVQNSGRTVGLDGGIYLDNSFNSSVYNNKAIDCYAGIYLFNCSGCSVYHNNASHSLNIKGIGLDSCFSCSIYSNNAINNWADGISILDSSNCFVCCNNASNNGLVGIELQQSSNCSVYENIASYNRNTGIFLGFSSNNTLYHNNFINNPHQTSIWGECFNNTWDNGCEGNYWSNYNGTDFDGDGIGDEYLPWEGVDNYPLMNIYWNPADVNHDLKIDIYDVVLACSAYTSTPSDPNWNCHCDIAEPYGVIDIYDIVMICSSYGKEYLP